MMPIEDIWYGVSLNIIVQLLRLQCPDSHCQVTTIEPPTDINAT